MRSRCCIVKTAKCDRGLAISVELDGLGAGVESCTKAMFASPALSTAAARKRRDLSAPAAPDRRRPLRKNVKPIGILVVEDEAGIQESVAEILDDEGYEVVTASNGAEALQVLRALPPPDVILLDLMMPVMDGWRFRVEQKRDPTLAHIPVIAMSASNTAQAEAIDAAAFASKPLKFDELLDTIERVVSVAEAARVEHTDRLAALGTLTAGVAHEISNPLSYVMANLQQLATDVPGTPPHLAELVSGALDGARRIAETLKSIQRMAHAAQDRTTSLVDLRGCVERAVKMVGHEFRHRGELRLGLDPVPPVRANGSRLEQVVMNLLMNAFHAVDERESQPQVVTVTTRALPSGRVRFEIADTGPGVPPHLTERIFEPFFTTRRVGVGTGLGLSICRSIIKDPGGEIGVLAAPHGGAVFWFELPAAIVTGTLNSP